MNRAPRASSMPSSGAGAELAGVGVAVTRAGATAGRLGDILQAAGATVVHWPCIRFVPPADPVPLAEAVRRREAYDWIAVTSPRAARSWRDACRALEADAGSATTARTPHPSLAVAGPATAAVLRGAGWSVDRIPPTYSAEGLVESFESAGDARGARILYPCSDRAGDALSAGLERLGATVERVVAYRTLPAGPDPAEVVRAARSGRVDVVTFTSPSTVEGFLSAFEGEASGGLGLVRRRLAAAAIGPTTAAALAAAEWPSEVAAEATLEGLRAAAGRVASRGPGRHGTGA